MKKILFILFCLSLYACCKQDDCDDEKLPDCIQQMIDVGGNEPPFFTVKMQRVDGECHYWLNTGANAYDGVEYVVNSHCDTVCEIGGFRPPAECSKKYDFDKWEIIWSGSMVYKPNIYIYPDELIDLSVKIKFPLGGRIVTSIPQYGTGWNVSVDTSGLINDRFSFLFYESSQPDIWQREYGWNVQTDKLESFFRRNMTEYGFKGREIDDFIYYWIPRLNDYSSYSIYPQTKSLIDKVIQLDFSKKPDNIFRLFYVIEGHNQVQDKLSVPNLDTFARDGFYITEWGVILD